MKVLFLLPLLFLAGCETMSPTELSRFEPFAPTTYNYYHYDAVTGSYTALDVVSDRDFAEGFQLDIQPDGKVEFRTERVESQSAQRVVEAIEDALSEL